MEQPSGSSADDPKPQPKYVAGQPRTNPNISSTPPLREFAVAGTIVLVAILLLYWGLGGLAGWAATKLPYEIETKLADSLAILNRLDATDSPDRERLQALVERLAAHDPTPLRYRVHLVAGEEANAAALPGGHIMVSSGLLESAESENELAMVLGHEMGHAMHRDHLRALGRRVVLAAIVFNLGGDRLAQQLLGGGLETLDLEFSRQQELAADAAGLHLLAATYGHVGGATAFFEKHLDDTVPIELFNSHPLSRKRIDALEQLAAEHGYEVGEPTPW